MEKNGNESEVLDDYKSGDFHFKDLAEKYKHDIEQIYDKIISEGMCYIYNRVGCRPTSRPSLQLKLLTQDRSNG